MEVKQAMEDKRTFEERKQAALNAARAEGILDVVTAGDGDGVSPETVELAAKLIKKIRKTAYKRMEASLEAQQKNE